MIVCEGEMVNVAESQARVQSLEQENITLQNSVEEWENKFNDLKGAQQQLFDEMLDEYKKSEQQRKSLHQAASEFLTFGHHGKEYSEVGIRQQQRQRQTLKTRAEKALWFAKTFGLNIKFLELETTTKEPVRL